MKKLFFFDTLAIISSFLLGYWIRFYWIFPSDKGIAPLLPYCKMIILLLAGWLIIFNALGLYRPRLFVTSCEEIAGLFRGLFWGAVFLLAGTFFYRGFAYSRIAVGMGILLSLPLLILCRFFVRRFFLPFSGKRRVAVAIEGKGAEIVIRRIERHPEFGLSIAGIFSFSEREEEHGKSFEGLPCLGKVEDIPIQIEHHPEFDLLILGMKSGKEEMVEKIFSVAEEKGIRCYIFPELHSIAVAGSRIETLDGFPLFLPGSPLEEALNLFLKRSVDLLLGFFFFLLLLPLMAAISFGILLSSGRPIFFRQKRIGKDGKSFSIIKFRTMHQRNLHSLSYTLPDDERITGFGRFLRRTNLDEIPQICNVLSGEMSLVGPRPISVDDTAFFEVPGFPLRHKVKPGITGWAQVHGLRGGRVEPEERIRYDLYYIEEWSLWLDMAILFISPFAFTNAY